MKLFNFLVLFLLMSPNLSASQTQDFSTLEPRISKLMSDYKAAGLSVGVVTGNKLAYAQGFGFRDIKNQKKVSPTTTFPIGSITKSFTSALLGMLDDEALISLHAGPALYVPDFSFATQQMNTTVSLYDLLSHRSGLGNQGTSEILFPNKDMLRVSQRIKFLKPQAEVKNSFAYSNTAYTLAATVYEQMSDETWEVALKRRIFEPLNMKRTFTSLEAMKAAKNYARPYGVINDELVSVKFEEFNNSLRAAGAIKSNVIDLANWITVWLSDGDFNGLQVIPRQFIANATRLHNIKSDAYDADAFLQGEGLGWRLRTSYGKFRVEHGGNTFGFSTTLGMFPFEDFGIVVMANQDNSILPYLVFDMIVRYHFGLPAVTQYPISVKPVYKPRLETQPYNIEKPMSYPLSKYVGTYSAQGYGSIHVIQKNERLFLKFPDVTFHLEHVEKDEFYMEGTNTFDDVYNPEFTVSFEATNNEITLLKLHSQIEPITFTNISI